MSNKSAFKISYKRVLCGSVLIGSFFIYAPILYTIFYQANTRYTHTIDTLTTQANHRASKILGVAMSMDDENLLNTTMEGLNSYSFIYSLTIRDNYNDIIAYSINDNFDEMVIDELRVSEIPIYSTEVIDEDEKIKIGMLVVSAISISYSSQLLPIYNAPLFALLFAVITGLLFNFTFKSFKNNLKDMVRSAKDLASGEKGIRLTEDTRVKEIYEFSKAFNKISRDREKAWHDIEYQGQVFELKRNILQIAAHELRSPIGGIKTLLDIAIHHSNADRKEDLHLTLKKTYSEIDSLNKHITAILCLSALENNTLTRADDWVYIPKFVSDLDKQFAVKSHSKQYIVWECVTKGDSNLEAYMDFDLVTIIVSNAIDNAIKYTDKGYVHTTFELIEGHLEVIVHDSGVGLTKEEINILENSPNQLQNNINRTKDGWGIGLATMYRFADFLDGHVFFDSSKGFGTKVTITIPVVTRKAEIVHEVTNEKAVVSSMVRSINSNDAYSSTYVLNVQKDGFKVFVLDNDQSHLDQMEVLLSPEFLRRNDVEVTFCTTSTDAIRHVEETKFDLLLIDYHMPDLDGIQFLKFIEENENKCKESSKCIVTADANIPAEERDEMLKHCNKIFSKGITSKEIRGIISCASLKAVS